MTKTGLLAAIACSFIVGLISGGGVVEMHYRSSAQQDRFLFENKLRCQALAKKYEDDNTSLAVSTVSSVSTVDYSPARHSCVAEVVRNMGSVSAYIVVDLGTNETIYTSTPCENCNLQSSQDAAFAKAVASAGSPDENSDYSNGISTSAKLPGVAAFTVATTWAT
jgi:hypothetical protein